MRRLLIATLLVFPLGVLPVLARQAPVKAGGKARPATPRKSAAPRANLVAFPAAGLQLRQPEGFTRAENFHGFGMPEKKASVMVMRIPGPYEKLSAGFTPEQLKPRGMELQAKEAIQVEGQQGLLLKIAQSAGGERFLKWIAVFGDAKETFMITAAFPEGEAKTLSPRLKATVLSARRSAGGGGVDPGTDRNFSLVGSKKLVLTPGLGKELMYTKDGVIPAKHPDDPLFIASPALSRVTIADPNDFARKRLHSTAKTEVTRLTTHQPVQIAGCRGFESVAAAKNTATGNPVALYQVMLFREGSYFLMQGLAAEKESDTYLPEFKAMARSLRFTK